MRSGETQPEGLLEHAVNAVNRMIKYDGVRLPASPPKLQVFPGFDSGSTSCNKPIYFQHEDNPD
jgi:hypothetical protein